MRHHLDRQTALEEPLAIEVMNGRRLRVDERVIEPFVLVARQRTIQVVALPIVECAGGTRGPTRAVGLGCHVQGRLRRRDIGDGVLLCRRRLPETASPARCAEHLRPVDGLGQDDRTDRIVEVEVVRADECRDVGREVIRGERSGRDNRRNAVGCGNARDLATDHGDAAMTVDRLGHEGGKSIAIHRERRTRRDAGCVGAPEHDRPQAPHLFFQQPDSVVEFVTAE